jgi:hypothetical protein
MGADDARDPVAADGFGSGDTSGPADLDALAAFERSARFWVHAYPARWRQLYGDEVVTLLVDLRAAGVRRVGAGAAWDLLRTGWGVRLRGRPDPLSWVLYRFFDLPLRGFADWVADDINGRWYLVRRHVPAWLLLAGMVWYAVDSPTGTASGAVGFAGFLGLILLAVPLVARPTRRQARKRHLLQEDPPPGPPFYGRPA